MKVLQREALVLPQMAQLQHQVLLTGMLRVRLEWVLAVLLRMVLLVLKCMLLLMEWELEGLRLH